MTERRPLVAYDDAGAARYRAGRTLTGAQRERWRAAVGRRLPDGPLALVVDAGAGTGAFLPVWRDLGAHRIVAVEPSPAMRAVAREGAAPDARVLAGELASLPVRTGSADVVWVSAVLHHATDRAAALAEVARALRPGGRLLVRGLVPGSSRVPWLDLFPGAERALARFPDAAAITAWAVAAGLAPVAHDIVADDPVDPAAVAAWVMAMRHTDSLLTALSDAEVAAGVAALDQRPRLEPVTLSLLAFARPAVTVPGDAC